VECLAVARHAAVPAAGAEHWLGTAEGARAQAMPPAARAAFVASRLLLRRLLEQATGIAAARWELSAQAGCAPVAGVRDPGESVPAPSVSLSHRLDWVAAATGHASAGAIGVDVECLRPSRSAAGERAALMLSPHELDAWQCLAAADREPALLCAWVAKEAWFKAVPAGAAPWDFRSIDASACDAAQANVRVWQAGQVFVGLCCADARALARFACEGLPEGEGRESSWRVGAVS
jgi:phosphopantetheinyl transferase